MTYWEIARLYRLGDTGVNGPTYAYNERPATTTRVGGDTVWMKKANGGSYRSVLRNDTLIVIQTTGTRTRDETWVIKGDSAHQLDKSGKVLLSLPKAVVVAPRRIAEVNESNVNRPPPL